MRYYAGSVGNQEKVENPLAAMAAPYKPSKHNIADIKALAWETVCGVPLTESVPKFWRPVVQKSDRLPLADRVPLNQTTFYVTARPYAMQKVKGTL